LVIFGVDATKPSVAAETMIEKGIFGRGIFKIC